MAGECSWPSMTPRLRPGDVRCPRLPAWAACGSDIRGGTAPTPVACGGYHPPGRVVHQLPDDPAAHYARKHTTQGVGDKVQRTETCDDDLPQLITHATPPLAQRPMARRPAGSTPRCSSGAHCLVLTSWTPAFGTPSCWSTVKGTTTSICSGPRASMITGKPAREPVLTPSTSRLIGTDSTRPVRLARPASAGRPL